MPNKTVASWLILTIPFFWFFLPCQGKASPVPGERDSPTPEASVIPEEKETDGPRGFHFSWKDGLHVEGPKRKITLRMGGSAKLDLGRLDADDPLARAFPDFVGQTTVLRSLRVNSLLTFFETVEWKLEIDFANTTQIKQNWFGLVKKIPYLGYIRAGYMKEPLSLEVLTSSTNLTFMEQGLPVGVFAPGSNLGIRLQNTAGDERMTWSLGGFWNVQATDKLDDARDRIDASNGVDLTLRGSALPWFEENGRRLFHLALGYSHRFPSGGDGNFSLRYRTRPETHLTSDSLVDTKDFSATRLDLFNLELAAVFGLLSYQAEIFYSLPGAESGGTHQFWGYYLFGSVFLTGEHRPYKKSEAVFTRVKPNHDFRPLKGEWGAWELTGRISYVDLNDKKIQGGKEFDITLGVNGHLTSNLQVMFNWVRAWTKDRGTDPALERGKANIFQGRLQLAF